MVFIWMVNFVVYAFELELVLFFTNLKNNFTKKVPGYLEIGSICSTPLECGVNTFCEFNKTCQCQYSLTSINNIDCCKYTFNIFILYFYLNVTFLDASSITSSKMYVQFLYQDTNYHFDEYDQIHFKISNMFDELIFNHTTATDDIQNYKGLEVLVNEYSKIDSQFFISLVIYFKTPTKMTIAFINTFLNVLNTQSRFNISTQFNSTGKFDKFIGFFYNKSFTNEIFIDFKNNFFINNFAEIKISDSTGNRLIDENCNVDSDCSDPNSYCVESCLKSNCNFTVSVCKCRIDYFESINPQNNNFKCCN